MKAAVSKAIEELKHQYPTSQISMREDEQGGAYVVIDSVDLGESYEPNQSWMGFHIAAQYPYADIYPVFVDGNIMRADGKAFTAPITPGAVFEGKAAIQISRRSSAAQTGTGQRAVTKTLKILAFLKEYK